MKTDATYRHIQGLNRGLQVLQALNQFDAGGAAPRELAELTGLNRTTVKRILETLVTEGFVRAADARGSYGLAPKVSSLSRGLTDEARLLHHAVPAARELGDATGWSLRISTPQDNAMLIRESTHRDSTLAFEWSGGVRSRIPILLTAAGRACFAGCDDTARQRIVERLRAQQDEQTCWARNDRLLEQLTRRTLDDGFGLNEGDWGERKLGAIGVAIRQPDGHAIGSLSMLYLRRAVSRPTLENEIFPALRRCVDSIEHRLSS